MDLDGRQLRYFVRVAEDLNFTRAARKLHLAQQTLSESIGQLERQLGVQLLERSPQKVELTPAGLELLARARDILERSAAAVTATRAAARRAGGSIAVGTPDWPSGIAAFRRAVEGHRRAHGASSVLLDPVPWTEHLAAVADHRIDVGVTVLGVGDRLRRHLDGRRLRREGAGWVLVAEDHPLGAAARVAASDLASHPVMVIARDDHPVLHDRLVAHLAGVVPDAMIEPNNDGSMASAFAHALVGGGAVWVSASMAEHPPAGMRAVRVPDLDLEVDLLAVTRAGDELPAGDDLLAALERSFAPGAGAAPRPEGDPAGAPGTAPGAA